MPVVAEKTLAEYLKKFGKKPCTKVWRIQKSKVILQEKGNLGTFYSEECYIAMKICKEKENLKTDVHVWIGSDVPQEGEEKAIRKVSEADDELEHVTLYRQIQFHETREFLDLFPQGVKYLKGLSSQHKQFDNGEYIKRLFQIKGKRNIRVIQVPLEVKSLNEGDSFMLDDEWTLYCWNGKSSSKVERTKAIELAKSIRNEYCFGKAEIIIADQNIDIKAERLFFQALGGRGKGKIPKEIKDDDIDGSLNVKPADVRIYSVCDEKGEIEVNEITTTPLHRDILQTKDCFIVDGGTCGIYVWVGTECSKQEKQEALKHAISFIERYGYPEWTPVTRILEGNETKHFRAYFEKWPEKRFITNKGHLEVVEKQHSNEFEQSTKTVQEDMIDSARGPIRIWRVEGSFRISWPHKYYGTFYGGDVYIIQYKCSDTNQYILYIWHGPTSDLMEQENGRKLAQQIDTALKGKATHIQVVYGNEPEHFLRLFKGKLTILLGGINSENIDDNHEEQKENEESRNIYSENDNEENSDVYFYHISGNTLLNTKAVQIPLQASLLQSEDVFLLIQNELNYIWVGNLADEHERDFAEVAADRIATNGDLIIIKEGYEPPQFWSALGGKAEHNTEKKQILEEYTKPRVFHCSDQSGHIKVTEVNPFDQMDLNGDDVMILDAHNEIFLWIGKGANAVEKKQAWNMIMEFVEASERSIEVTYITHIKQGFETQSFTSHFDNWDKDKAQDFLKYATLKKEVQKENTQPIDLKFKKRSVTWGETRVMRRAQYKPRQ